MSEIGLGQAFTLLQIKGDLIEQRAASTPAIAKAVTQYAGLWANYVLPSRVPDNPAFVQGPLKDLSELSYSCLVRLASAEEAAQRGTKSCELLLDDAADLGAQILRTHESLFAFFCNAGAAVEVLNRAAEPFKEVLFRTTDDSWGSGGWFYGRRNGFVHDRLTPVFARDGLLHIDAVLLCEKHPTWRQSEVSPRELTELMRELLAQLNDELANGWRKLHDAVRRTAPPISTTILDAPMSSASPRSAG